jgi:hypothetical protein
MPAATSFDERVRGKFKIFAVIANLVIGLSPNKSEQAGCQGRMERMFGWRARSGGGINGKTLENPDKPRQFQRASASDLCRAQAAAIPRYGMRWEIAQLFGRMLILEAELMDT